MVDMLHPMARHVLFWYVFLTRASLDSTSCRCLLMRPLVDELSYCVYWILLDFIGFYWILLDFIGYFGGCSMTNIKIWWLQHMVKNANIRSRSSQTPNSQWAVFPSPFYFLVLRPPNSCSNGPHRIHRRGDNRIGFSIVSIHTTIEIQVTLYIYYI